MRNRKWIGSLLPPFVFLLTSGLFALQDRPALAQAEKAAGVFDDDAEKKDDKAKEAEKKDALPKPPAVTDRDTIGFTQENAAAQMTELEERMFRLSEALRGLEPENASRLRLALKFSREEQILDQMRETHGMLKDAQISKAETEVRELIAKLEHLRNLLLADDLDFQLKLARLRQMRETYSQLERIAKEENRELGWSRFAIEQRKALDRFKAKRPDLAGLLADQQSVVEETKKAPKDDDDKGKEARKVVIDRLAKGRSAVAAVAADPNFSTLQPPFLRQADTHFADAAAALEKADLDEAAAAAEKASGLIKDELARLDEQLGQAEKTVSAEEFKRREGDQTKNRASADRLAEGSVRLGDVGVSLRKDLIRASVAMREAEEGLVKSTPEPAIDSQTASLDSIAKASDEFERAMEKLLIELRIELQARLVNEIMEMHEMQAAVREMSQAQAPKVAQKSRTALIAVNNLAKTQADMGDRAEKLLGLVEETEYGIALPTTLRVFAREMRFIEGWLKEGNVEAKTVGLETRIEEDLITLLGAVRRLPPTTAPFPGLGFSTDQKEQEREINRLIAELKMVRLLQARLNDDVVGVDKIKPEPVVMTPALRKEVEALEASQDEIRDSLAKIAERLVFPDDNS